MSIAGIHRIAFLKPTVALWTGRIGVGDFHAFGWTLLLGIPSEPANIESWIDRVHPDDRDAAISLIHEQLRGDGMAEFHFECRIADQSGDYRWILLHGQRIESDDNNVPYLVTTSVDVTTLRHSAAELLGESEWFRVVADTVPAMIWVSGIDGRCDWFNQRWLDFTGRTLAAALSRGRCGDVDPEDQEEALARYQTAFANREPVEVEYRLRNSDGDYRWILDRAVPRYDAEDRFVGYVGSCVDVSHEKEFAGLLRDREEVMRQLHTIEERERSYMACTIHDGLLQDIIGADMLLQGIEHLPPEEINERHRCTRAIIRTAIAHGRRLIGELRPMILDEQGIVGAIEFFCAELENRGQLRVRVRSGLKHDIKSALWGGNLYKIVQEALTNVEQHSQADQATVDLTQQDGRLIVVIRDDGVGFQHPSSHETYGLRCMQERAKIFGGIARITSMARQGTTVRIEIPLPDPLTHAWHEHAVG